MDAAFAATGVGGRDRCCADPGCSAARLMPSLNLGREPVAIVTVVVLALGALNTQVALPHPFHQVVNAVLVVLGAVVTRSAVTPTTSPKVK